MKKSMYHSAVMKKFRLFCYGFKTICLNICLECVFSPSPFSRLPVYQALFAGFRRCYTERQVPVLLPGVMMKGQAQVQVTLHHHVCVQLCASVAALPPVYFPVLVSSTHMTTLYIISHITYMFRHICFGLGIMSIYFSSHKNQTFGLPTSGNNFVHLPSKSSSNSGKYITLFLKKGLCVKQMICKSFLTHIQFK